MSEPASSLRDPGAGTYICTTCTNRLSTYKPLPLEPCTVCGGSDWRTVAGGARSPATPAR